MDDLTGDVSVPSDFDLAAQACGYDTTTGIGAQLARGDHRVWDLLDAWQVQNHIAAAHAALDAAEKTVVRP